MPSGSCNCGAVKIEIPDSSFPGESVICHCGNCRASSGSVFTVNLVVPSKDIKISNEENVTTYQDKNTDSGHTALRRFCKTCGSPILTGVAEAPDQSYVKSGLFKIGSVPAPKMEIFKRNFESWQKGQEGTQLVD